MSKTRLVRVRSGTARLAEAVILLALLLPVCACALQEDVPDTAKAGGRGTGAGLVDCQNKHGQSWRQKRHQKELSELSILADGYVRTCMDGRVHGDNLADLLRNAIQQDNHARFESRKVLNVGCDHEVVQIVYVHRGTRFTLAVASNARAPLSKVTVYHRPDGTSDDRYLSIESYKVGGGNCIAFSKPALLGLISAMY